MAALRLGTRGSALALAQAGIVARALEAHGADVELIAIRTSGDEPPPEPRSISGQNAAANREASGGASEEAPVEDKARFVKELEQALLAGEIDLAVHSAKDVPADLPDGLEIVAVPERADPRDALCLAPRLAQAAAGGGATAPHSLAARPLDPLPEGATVGTASLRRRAELLSLRPDLRVVDLRGNVDTRLRRLAEGGPAAASGTAGTTPGAAAGVAAPSGGRLDAIVLAAAGLARLGRGDAGSPLPESALIPAAGQGCLALEARAGDDATRRLACRLTDPRAFACLSAERALVAAIGATCHTPVGAHATILNHSFVELNAFVGTPDGTRWIRDDVRGLAENPRAVGHDAANRLAAAGAAEILAAAEQTHGR